MQATQRQFYQWHTALEGVYRGGTNPTQPNPAQPASYSIDPVQMNNKSGCTLALIIINLYSQRANSGEREGGESGGGKATLPARAAGLLLLLF